ncbi:MAG: MinD/ParA family protein [Planctomycetaceae bacterium]
MIPDLLSRDTVGEFSTLWRAGSRQEPAPVPGPPPRRCRSVALASGQTGAGTSFLARHLSLALSRQGHAVCLLEEGTRDGISLWTGSPAGQLADVLAGHRTLSEILQRGPGGLRSIAGAQSLAHVAECSRHRRADFIEQLLDLEAQCDVLVIDAGSVAAGDGVGSRWRLAQRTDALCLVATPEPQVVPETLALLRGLPGDTGPHTLRLIINQADSPEQAHGILARIQQGARNHGGALVTGVGYIPFDQAASQAVLSPASPGTTSSRARAARAIDQIAHRLASTVQADSHSPSSLSFPSLHVPSVAPSVV